MFVGFGKDCSIELIARGPMVAIHRCSSCGVVSLSMGPISMRLDPGAIESLWLTLGAALAKLSEEEASQTSFLRERGVA